MPGPWTEQAAPRFLADILRDYCAISLILEEQFSRFERAGHLSFPVLRDLVGNSFSKGPLWRLKDLAHHFLRDAPGSGSAARFLDWGIGYIFHETHKLVEATHQHRHYAPRLNALLEAHAKEEGEEMILKSLSQVVAECGEDMARGVRRTRRLLENARGFFIRAYAGQDANRQLARFLYHREDLVRAVFREEHGPLIAAIYQGRPERMALEAAFAFLEGGYGEAALEAAEKGAALAPECKFTRDALDTIRHGVAELHAR